MSTKNLINLSSNQKKKTIKGDAEQLYRVFINLIKNSEDSISEKKEKNKLFKGKINIEIDDNKDYISISLADNGVGIKDTTKIMTPYFTTKKDGTGLGLPIVSKIINEHKGELVISDNNPGAKVLITLPKTN
jgi:two-component system nitrogen regulation sensor histidine kinase NtrY